MVAILAIRTQKLMNDKNYFFARQMEIVSSGLYDSMFISEVMDRI